MAQYTFNNVNLILKKFNIELEMSGLSLSIDYYKIDDPDIIFYTNTDLTSQQQTDLQNLINNHNASLEYIKSSVNETKTNSTSFEEKLKIEEVTENKDYYINWYYEYGGSKTNNPIEAIVKVGNEIISHIVSESKDTKDRRPCSGRLKRTLEEGITTVTIEYKSTSSNTNVIIRNANLFLEEV